ncbi:Flp family type IVb pilin [uncultured Roseovarius sp.]|uniref:Flp family type IVb pilin n=1 Tax=Roseovarius sp. TaxID=1486281 RepID=UPI0025DF6B1E|nr:hypothetical protein [uncultured Roseovarius sp.]
MAYEKSFTFVNLYKNSFNAAQIPPEFAGYIRAYHKGSRPLKLDGPYTEAVVKTEQTDPLEGQTMMNFIKQFTKEEDGAVTVDWVVLTAAVVGLGVAGVASVNTGITGLAGSISTELSGAGVADLGTLGIANTSTTTTTTP